MPRAISAEITDSSAALECPTCHKREIAAEGKSIHFCPDRSVRPAHLEYAGCYDGRLIITRDSNHECEVALDAYAYELLASGETATAAELDGGALSLDEIADVERLAAHVASFCHPFHRYIGEVTK